MSNFWNELVKRFGPREDIINIPGASAITNKYIDLLQKRALMPRLSDFKGKIALDIGSGIGRWTLFLIDKACFVIGIDISQEMIKIAKEKIRKNNVDFILSTANALPLRSNSVDLSLSCTCLQHITEEEKLEEGIREITRVTRNSILILELMSKTKWQKLIHYPTLIIPKSNYISTLTKFGAKSVEDFGVDFLPFVKLLENLRNFLFNKLKIIVPFYDGSLTQRLLQNTYQVFSVFALFLSLPFNKLLGNPSSDVTRHTLLVAEMR